MVSSDPCVTLSRRGCDVVAKQRYVKPTFVNAWDRQGKSNGQVSCNLPITLLSVDNSDDQLLCCKPTSVSYDMRKIAEMVWWNISGATISHVLRINCVSMAHGWRTCGAYGVWMAMPLHMVSCMRTWPLCIHGASGMCTVYTPSMRGDQRDSMAYGGHMYSAWAAYMLNLLIHLIIYLSCECDIKCPVECICI